MWSSHMFFVEAAIIVKAIGAFLGVIWGIYLLFVSILTGRELWKGRRKKRR